MKRFSFELEDVLQFRTFEQRQAELALALALATEKEIQDRLDALAARQAESVRQARGSTELSVIADASRFSAFVRLQSERLLEELSQAKLASDEKRLALQKIMQKTDALERLKDEQREEWRLAEDRAEDDAVDDIVTGRFRR
ncbi:MAG: flagellar export protein FliJ [Treponemataceae bacterium]|nr:flagellar export protein FliJ [Treponemataceae bacterium]